MADEQTTPQFRAPCRYLRNKEMYYGQQDDDEFASGLCWCDKTQESFGPDGAAAAKLECCAGRSCYVG